MRPRNTGITVPVTRVATILRYTGYLQSLGAPVGGILAQARIPEELTNHPAAALSLEKAFRFGELANRALGTEHLGLQVGLAASLDDLGPYGRLLKQSVTVHDYLRKGISFYNTLMTGQRLWISEHGDGLRLNVATDGKSELGKYMSQMETLVVTIGKLREAAGPDWVPREISLAYTTCEPLPAIDLFAGARVQRGTGKTYFTIPRAMTRLRFPNGGGIAPPGAEEPGWDSLPEDLGGLVRRQVESLLSCRGLQIDLVAETLAMSTRSLQRALANQGLSYSQILTDARIRQAVCWLENTDKPIAEIAFDLAYADASNFTRAFRRQIGVSPLMFRNNAKAS